MTLGGYLGDHPPIDEAGYIEFARSLPKSEIFEVIKDAEPLTSPTPYQFSANLRRHYEELSRFPEGLLVFGDALCSFNPIYGQGMTVACTEALVLRECLAAGPHGIARRFFQAASKVIDIPWQWRSAAICNIRQYRASARLRSASSTGTLPNSSRRRNTTPCWPRDFLKLPI